MRIREALDAFEIAARAELVKQFSDQGGQNVAATMDKVNASIAAGRKATAPIIRKAFGDEVADRWEKTQDTQV